ncbi:hypothetical protein HMPREF1141_1207 [Clostridium sp. MSTE9]|nr:hypothetical protein HMPREF1141_1207 [Clostridium sp. MSTE9]
MFKFCVVAVCCNRHTVGQLPIHHSPKTIAFRPSHWSNNLSFSKILSAFNNSCRQPGRRLWVVKRAGVMLKYNKKGEGAL